MTETRKQLIIDCSEQSAYEQIIVVSDEELAQEVLRQAEYDAWYAEQQTLSRLAELDKKVPRGLEDLISAQGIDVTTLPQVTQDILSEKAALRAQL